MRQRSDLGETPHPLSRPHKGAGEGAARSLISENLRRRRFGHCVIADPT